jgi:hypothetical protein
MNSMVAGQRGKGLYLYCARRRTKEKKNDFPSVVQPMLTVKTGDCSRPKSSGGYKKLLEDMNRFFFLPFFRCCWFLFLCIYIYIYIILVSLFKSVVRFPELMVRNGGPEEIKKIYIKTKDKV